MLNLKFEKISEKQIYVAIGLFVSFVFLMIAYLLGASEGIQEATKRAKKEQDKLNIEISTLREKLVKERSATVAECAQKCADEAINCEQVCATEVEESLKLCSQIKCGKAKVLK